MQATISKNEQGVVRIPIEDLMETPQYKMRIIDGELIVYPAHLKLHQVVTPQQLAKAFSERPKRRPAQDNPVQIPDEALRRENMYE